MKLSKIKQDRYYFCEIYEVRISFVSHIRNMANECYLKQPKSMSEIELYKKIAENPKLVKCLKRKSSHPFIRKYSQTHISWKAFINFFWMNICLQWVWTL